MMAMQDGSKLILALQTCFGFSPKKRLDWLDIVYLFVLGATFIYSGLVILYGGALFPSGSVGALIHDGLLRYAFYLYPLPIVALILLLVVQGIKLYPGPVQLWMLMRIVWWIAVIILVYLLPLTIFFQPIPA